jgi:hypothetical protein
VLELTKCERLRGRPFRLMLREHREPPSQTPLQTVVLAARKKPCRLNLAGDCQPYARRLWAEGTSSGEGDRHTTFDGLEVIEALAERHPGGAFVRALLHSNVAGVQRRTFLEAAARAGGGRAGNGAAAAGPAGTATRGANGAATTAGRLLVVGGSQGSRAVNELVVTAAGIWARTGKAPRIVHQTGAADAERMTAAYAGAGLPARTVEVRPFIEDMAAAMQALGRPQVAKEIVDHLESLVVKGGSAAG